MAVAGCRSATPLSECVERVLDLYVRRQLVTLGVRLTDEANAAVGAAFAADSTF